MKYIYIGLLFCLLYVGCGFKADPVYVDEKKEKKVGS